MREMAKRDSDGLEVLEGVTPAELARASKLCITKSGTITLEIASQGTPMLIFYRTSPAVLFLAYGLADTPYIGLINNLAGGVVCPERYMVRPCAQWIVEQALKLLRDRGAYERCREGIRKALAGLAVPGASARAARASLALI